MQLAKQEEEDMAVARRLMDEEGSQVHAERKKQKQQEAQDAKLSKKMTIASVRAEHRRQKYLQLVVNAPYASGVNVPTPAELWRDADPVIEDVMGGICISMLLPHIKSIDIKLAKKHIVIVEAARFVSKNEEMACAAAKKKPEHTTFDIDFEIEGHPVKIVQSDLHYEYASDSGMLHVYVDNVHLEGDGQGAEGQSGSGNSTRDRVLGGMLRGVKAGLSKIFSNRGMSGGDDEEKSGKEKA